LPHFIHINSEARYEYGIQKKPLLNVRILEFPNLK